MWLWIAIAVVLVCVIAFAVIVRRRREAQRVLEEHPKLQIAPLSSEARERYLQQWREMEGVFADDPEIAIRDADRLLQKVMLERGFPTGDFGRLKETLTPEEADVIEHYRLIHRVSVKAERTSLEDEEIQPVLVALRWLIENLVEAP